MANNMLSKFHSFDNHRVFLLDHKNDHPDPHAYVICMASYNLGLFYGKWINLSQDVEFIHREIKSMLSTSPTTGALEWAIYACGGFGPITLKSDEGIETIHAKANFIATKEDLRQKLLDYFDNDVDQAYMALELCYQGKFVNELEFAFHMLDKDSDFVVPDFVKLYIDYEMFKKDLFANDYYSIVTVEGVHVFSVL